MRDEVIVAPAGRMPGGNRLAFESQGDLAQGSNEGGRQIFVYTKIGITQVTHGLGASRNAALSRPTGIAVCF